MTKADDFQLRAKSIEDLVQKLEQVADPAQRAVGQELVHALMGLHGVGIERMLEIVRETSPNDSGNAIIDSFGRDQLVRNLLLLYGLHPQDLRTRVLEGLDKAAKFLNSHEATAELVSIDDAGVVTVHFRGKNGGCSSTAALLISRIEAAVQDAAPDAASILVKDAAAAQLAGPSFVSIAELQSGRAMAALCSERAHRSGD